MPTARLRASCGGFGGPIPQDCGNPRASVFDLLHLDSRSLIGAPYTERREQLTALHLPGQHSIQVPPYWLDTTPDTLLRVAGEYGLEGILAKRASSRYEPGRRSRSWIKIPLRHRDDMVIGGYTPGSGHRARTLGALLVGVYDEHGLRYAGHVGSGKGWNERTLAALTARLETLATAQSPFADDVPRDHARQARWVRPELVGEVAYRGWTTAGRLRHPSFLGLRHSGPVGCQNSAWGR